MVGEGVETGWRASLVDEGTVRLSSKDESDRITQMSAVQIRPPATSIAEAPLMWRKPRRNLESTRKLGLGDTYPRFSLNSPRERVDSLSPQLFEEFPFGIPHGFHFGLSVQVQTANGGRGATFHFTLPIQVTESTHPWLPNAFRTSSEHFSFDPTAVYHFVILTRSLLLAVSITS